MTAQVPDKIELDGTLFELVAIQNPWPFDPKAEGFTPVMPHTACWRGFVCSYAVKNDELRLERLRIGLAGDPPEWRGVKPQKGEFWKIDRMWDYVVSLPIAYSGGVIAAAGFIREFYVHMGFQGPHAFKRVKELIFDSGKLIESVDHSQKMAETRERIEAMGKNPNPRSSEEIRQFVESAFSLSYDDKWSS